MDRLISLNAVLSAIGEWIAHRKYDYTNATEYLRNRIKAIPSAEPRYCDRNICLRNEYNGISCDECEVGNPCLYCKHEFEPQERSEE